MEYWEKFEKLREILGDETVLQEVSNYFTADGKLLVKVNHRSRIVGFSSKAVAPVFEGSVEKYNLDGRKYRGTETEFDLVMEAPKRPRNEKGQFVKVG